MWFINDTFLGGLPKIQISLIEIPNIYMVFSVLKTKRPKDRLVREARRRIERGTNRWHKGDRERLATCASWFWQLVYVEGSAKYVSHEYWWLTIPLTVISSIPQSVTCPFISSIHMVWFIVIYYSLQLLWNDSFPCKSLSHKLRHFYLVSPNVLVCISPISIQLLYFPWISSHKLLQTLPMQDLLVMSLISHILTALFRKH